MSKVNRPIGVFDSGLGGISVMKDLHKLYPQEDIIYFGDSKFAPYGLKQRTEIVSRCIEICEFFISKGVKAIVIACNTATSAAVDVLRKRYPELPIIGMEPALKPAIECSKQHYVAVMATNFTLKEKKFADLMKDYQEDNTILKLPCPELVQMIENDTYHDEQLIQQQLHQYFDHMDKTKLDAVVLGCTHFVFFKQYIQNFLGNNVHVIDGNLGTCKHLMDILEKEKIQQTIEHIGEIFIYNSSKEEEFVELSQRLLDL